MKPSAVSQVALGYCHVLIKEEYYYVTKLGSITAAAQKLCLTQPTVTSAIHRLEEQLQVTLFLRGKKGVRLTHEGQLLWTRVEPAMELLLAGERELEEARTLEGGSLRIVSTEMGFRTYIIPTLQRFTADHPHVKIRCRNALTENVLDMVRKGGADIAVLHEPLPSAADLELRYLHTIEECFVGGTRYRSLSERIQTLSDLVEHPMISVPAGASTNQFVSSLFEKNGLTFLPDIEVTTIDLVIQAVEHNLGIGTLPVSEAADRLRAGTMFRIPIAAPPLERRAFVITSRTLPLSAAAKIYLDDYLFGPSADRLR